MNEGDDDKNAEECSSSWPATFTSPSDAQESEIPEQVALLVSSISMVGSKSCFQTVRIFVAGKNFFFFFF